MTHKVLQVKHYNDSAFVLRMERNDFDFSPGQYISVGKNGIKERRDYSIYSSSADDYLELLIKKVDGGDVSDKLSECEIGEELDLEGPFGNCIVLKKYRNKKILLVATGTGIAPYHSIVRSYPDLNYTVLHGVKTLDQLYGQEAFPPDRYISCLTGSHEGGFFGRVTDYLRVHSVKNYDLFYLCGNSEMIFEAFKLLQIQGIQREQIVTEIYF